MSTTPEPQTQAVLEFLNGPLAGWPFPINKRTMRIGSDRNGNDIIIDDPSILAQHATLFWDDGKVVVQGCNAQAIIAINGQLLRKQAAQQCRPDDEISLGTGKITFRLVANNLATPPMPLHTPGSPDETQKRIRTATGPHGAMPPVTPPGLFGAYTGTHQQLAAPPSTPRQQLETQVGAANPPTHTETTRYLCAAAHIDEKFRNYVFKHVLEEKHRAIGESYGVDLVALVKTCFAAQNRVMLRDAMLCVLFLYGIFLYFFIFAHGIPFLYFILLPLLIPYFVIYIILLSLLYYSRIPAPLRRSLSVLLFLFSPIPFPVLLLAWAVMATEQGITYYGRRALKLIKDKFNPQEIQHPLDANTLNELAHHQDGNVIVYSGFSPFVGSGSLVDAWSFSVDVTRGKRKIGTVEKPERFMVKELYDDVEKKVKELHIPRLGISNKLYVNGQAIRENSIFLKTEMGPPESHVDDEQMSQYMESFSEDVRYYKCFRVMSWRGELALSVYLRFLQFEKNLFVETVYMLLPPLKEHYYWIDNLAPGLTLAKIWNVIILSWLPTFRFFYLSPFRLVSHLAHDWRVNAEQKRISRLIQDNPAFDYGATSSLREAAASDEYRRYFQALDKEMYVKIIENQLLESIISFLDSKHIDTTDLKQRQETILNNGVIMSGGSFSAGNVAVGEQAKIINNRASQPGG